MKKEIVSVEKCEKTENAPRLNELEEPYENDFERVTEDKSELNGKKTDQQKNADVGLTTVKPNEYEPQIKENIKRKSTYAEVVVGGRNKDSTADSLNRSRIKRYEEHVCGN